MINKVKQSPFLLSLLTGLLLYVAWPPSPLFILHFVAWIPLLQLAALGNERNKSTFWFWKWSLLSMLIWNIGSTWWVWFASEGGAVAMIIANSLLMSLVLTAFYFTKKHVPKTKYMGLIVFWLSFELLHYNWDAAFPWLTLGNGLAKFPILIQWYEYTGVLGGSAWILICNIALFVFLKEASKKIILPVLVILVPILISVGIYVTYSNNNPEVKVLILQPNLDPYGEKFESDPMDIAFDAVEQIEENIDSTTQFVILPETAIPGSFDLSEANIQPTVSLIKKLTLKYPNAAIITGLETYELYSVNLKECKKPTYTARITNEPCVFYDVYNTAAIFHQGKDPVFYHKSKLVPGVEKMPFPKYLGFLENLSIDLGGTSGSLGSSPEPVVFYGPDSISTCGLVCYESIFGEYISRFSEQNIDFLTVITNDGWWGNTPGYKQHLYYGNLRAIESRKYITRSANTGISAIINDKGEIEQRTNWWEKAVIKGSIRTNNKKTFYTRNGDLLGQACKFISIFLILGAIVKRKLKGK